MGSKLSPYERTMEESAPFTLQPSPHESTTASVQDIGSPGGVSK